MPSTYSPELMINPLIILNMGSEMLYILTQRLKDQQIPIDKQKKVLSDTANALFTTERLFNSQPIMSPIAVRQLFNQITHCSIMRLNAQSMAKLFDLMTMGFKTQVLLSRDCYEFIESTLKHIDIVSTLLVGDNNKHIADLITDSRHKIIEIYLKSMSASQILVVRKCLVQWLYNQKTKVSVLLQQKLQTFDGHITHYFNEGILPKYTPIPGTVYQINGNRIKQSHIKLLNSNDCCLNDINYTFQVNELQTKLAENIYDRRASTDNRNCNERETGKQEQIQNVITTQLNNLSLIMNDSSSVDQSYDSLIKLDLFDLNNESQRKKSEMNANYMRFGASTVTLNEAMNKFNLDLSDKENKDTDTVDVQQQLQELEEEELFKLLE